LTIEHRSEIPEELRPGLGDWLFGCDVCQEVCPWNHHAAQAASRVVLDPNTRVVPDPGAHASPPSPFAPLPAANSMDLAALFDLTEADFRRRFRDTPLWRAHRRGLLRNAAIVLGNQNHSAAIPALTNGLADDEPLVREACVWALSRINVSRDCGHSQHERKLGSPEPRGE
jgi:epoxyqueuosine reductase